MSFFVNRRITVTGGAGFLGSFVVEKLKERGCRNIFVPRSQEFDLVEMASVKRLYQESRPDIVIHLAAQVGGIGANRANAGKFFYDNAMMGIQLMEQGRIFGVEKFIALGTVCAYPKFATVPFSEDNLWDGYPEEISAPYGLAKKMLLVQSQSYRKQYGFNSIYLLPVNLYGPRDNFDLETSHVIPALIRKCLEAKEKGLHEIVCWGDGTPTREFLYVEDCAEAILLATERYNQSDPVNVATGQDISLENLVKVIAETTGYSGRIVWDHTKPNGQPRRLFNTDRARELFGFISETEFVEGVRRTVAWYSSARHMDPFRV